MSYYTQKYLPMQVTPSPLYPALQAQVKLPSVLVQTAFGLQLCVPEVHSLMSGESK